MGADNQFLHLTTTGRNTGQPREIEIWFVEADGRLYILAEHGYKAQWVKNILAKPEVHVRVADQQWNDVVRVLDPDGDSETYLNARQLAREKYGWGEGLPVEIRTRERAERTIRTALEIIRARRMTDGWTH